MTDQNPVLVPAQGDQPQIVKLGTLAAQNIALALNIDEVHVPVIEKSINDEINAMSSHFTLAFADVRDQYEVAVARLEATFVDDVTAIKSSFNWFRENRGMAIAVGVLLLAIGVAIGLGL